MKVEDLIIVKQDKSAGEFWFGVQDDTEVELTRQYADDETVAVIAVGYSKAYDICGIKRLIALPNGDGAIKIEMVQDLKIRNLLREILKKEGLMD